MIDLITEFAEAAAEAFHLAARADHPEAADEHRRRAYMLVDELSALREYQLEARAKQQGRAGLP